MYLWLEFVPKKLTRPWRLCEADSARRLKGLAFQSPLDAVAFATRHHHRLAAPDTRRRTYMEQS